MPIQKIEHTVLLDEPLRPYDGNGSTSFKRWRRISRPGNDEVRWFPEDVSGNVLPWEAFGISVEAGSNHQLETEFRKMSQK